MGICFSSYGNETYARYSLWLSLYNNTAERQKVVDETAFYFAKLNDDDTYVMTDIKIDGFNMTDLSYQFNNIVAPADKYILVSADGDMLGYKKANGEIARIELSVDGGTKTISDVLIYDIPDYATVLYGVTNGRLIINEAKEDREDNIALYGNPIKVYDGMLSSNGWAHPYTDDTANISRIKRVEFGSYTKPTTLNHALYRMSNCTTIDLTNLDTTDCTDFWGTFSQNYELVTLDITKVIVTNKATNIGGIFNNCPKYIINSDLLHWDTSNVEFFGSAFGNIGNTTFTPKIDTSSGKTFNSMFGYNPRIQVIDCSTFDTSSAEDLSFMFTRCENLKTIYAKPTFVQPTGVQGINMFTFDNALVGGMGTVWDAAYVGLNRAYIDDLPTQPGYFTDKDAATYKTTLFADGTFIINESSHDRTANLAVHGSVLREYDPLDINHNYVFTTAAQVPWGDVINEIKSIYIGSQIQPTSTAYWFNNTTQCTEVHLDNLDTSKVTDMSYMFSGCGSQTIDVSNFNTARVTDMSGMFASCKATTLNLNSFDTRNVTDMDYMFENCMQLLSVNVTSFNTQNVTLMEAMFKNCGLLQEADLRSFNTSNVTNMKDMFAYCGYLHNLLIGSFNTINVTDMRGMFDGLGAVTGSGKTLDVRHFNTTKVTDMTNMFRGCNYTYIKTAFDTSNVTSMNNMFASCVYVLELDLSTYDTSKVQNMAGMFQSSSNLRTIYVTDFNTGAVLNSTNMFFNCNNIMGGAGTTYNSTKLDKTYARNDEPPTSPGYFTGKLATVLFQDGTMIINEDIDNRETDIGLYGPVSKVYGACTSSNPYNDQPWASEKTSVRSVKFGTTVKPTTMRNWFNGCTSLTSIDFTNLDTSEVTDMTNLFINCTSLANIDVSSFNTSKVTSMQNMFYGSAISTVDISGFDTSKVTNMNRMFYNCGNLTSINFSGKDTSNVTDMGYMFRGCSSLTNVNFAVVNTNKVTIMENMFGTCTSLVSIDLSNLTSADLTTVANMFTSCNSLTSVTFGSNFTCNKVTTMNGMFYGVNKIQTIDLSMMTTPALTNTNQMFSGCSQLRTIYASNGFNVTNVTSSDSMFSNCNNLRGGAGTTYTNVYSDKTRAKIDGGTSNPGYFTRKP